MSEPERTTVTLTVGREGVPTAVHALRGREALSEPFAVEVTFSGPAMDTDALRGERAQVEVSSPTGQTRYIAGAIDEVSVDVAPGLREGELLRYRARVVAEPWLRLRRRYGSRIFQEKSAVEIVQQLCRESGLEAERFDWRGLGRTYPTRVYCVQYEESDWDFASRLLEEEGVYYAFDQTPDGWVMFFGDRSDEAERTDPAEIAYAVDADDDGPTLRAWEVERAERLAVAKVSLDDYDMERPDLDLRADSEADEAVAREWYEYPGRYSELREGRRLARSMLAAHRSGRSTARLRTNAIATQAGRRLTVVDHPGLAAEQLVTAVTWALAIDDRAAGRRAEVRLETQPSAQVYAPMRRTPRPKVVGVQSAKVTGPAGQEIYVDEHGRIKVQFHWDLEGELDERSSCWVRVAQGHTTGSVMIPRIGWEVLVEFIDGDPDRPVCLGKLWNPLFPPPIPLPGGKTQTSHSSLSTPGGGGVNELILEDSAGSEFVSITAQHDVTVVAANNKLLNVGRDASHAVTGSRTVSIGGDETVALKANSNTNVGGAHSVSVGGNHGARASGSYTEEVTGAFTMTVGAMELIKVGSVTAAVLQVVADEAIDAATGMAASAAQRAEAALLGPIAPALSGARAALGGMAARTGPAAPMLGPAGPMSHPAMAAAAPGLAASPASLSAVPAIAAQTRAALGGALAELGVPNTAAQEAAAAAAAAGGGGGGGGPSGPTGGGTGTWSTTVGGAVSESIGGVCVINGGRGVSFAIGGSNTERVGGARVEKILGGKSETTGSSKQETVGIYMLKAAESLAITAKAAAVLNIAGSQRQKIGGSHSITAEGPLVINAPKLSVKASGTITLACGACKVIIKSGGVYVEGASSLTIEGSTVLLDENVLGT